MTLVFIIHAFQWTSVPTHSLFCDCDLRWYVVILFTADNGRSTDVLGPGTAKIKLTIFDASGTVSFSPLVMIHS